MCIAIKNTCMLSFLNLVFSGQDGQEALGRALC